MRERLPSADRSQRTMNKTQDVIAILLQGFVLIMSFWFTADTHFNHEGIITHSARPFSSLEDMTETMISRWNECVLPGDTVFHLGDFALSWGKKHYDTIDGILARLNGQKWLICGNHDRDEVKKNQRWAMVKDYHEINLDMGGPHKQRIVMFHYALRVWNQMHRGAWLLHGHSHGNLTDIGGRSMDVGVDCHGFRPIGVEAVAGFMRERETVSCDHHV